MAIKDALLPELDHEAATTRKLLERLPADKLAWQPHPKSMTLGRLAQHIATLPGWGHMTLTTTELDLGKEETPAPFTEKAQFLAAFDERIAKTRKALDAATDADFLVSWSLKMDGNTLFSMPRITVFRTFVMNHLIHHRGQFSVYLRENDVPLPAMYGPSADEK